MWLRARPFCETLLRLLWETRAVGISSSPSLGFLFAKSAASSPASLCDEMGRAALDAQNTQGPDGQAQIKWGQERHKHKRALCGGKSPRNTGLKGWLTKTLAGACLLASAFPFLSFLCLAFCVAPLPDQANNIFVRQEPLFDKPGRDTRETIVSPDMVVSDASNITTHLRSPITVHRREKRVRRTNSSFLLLLFCFLLGISTPCVFTSTTTDQQCVGTTTTRVVRQLFRQQRRRTWDPQRAATLVAIRFGKSKTDPHKSRPEGAPSQSRAGGVSQKQGRDSEASPCRYLATGLGEGAPMMKG